MVNDVIDFFKVKILTGVRKSLLCFEVIASKEINRKKKCMYHFKL